MPDTNQRSSVLERTVILILVAVSIGILVFTEFGANRSVYYDCRDAHWHPDVPIEVKRECSKLMYEQWKEKNERKNDPSIHENSRDVLTT